MTEFRADNAFIREREREREIQITISGIALSEKTVWL